MAKMAGKFSTPILFCSLVGALIIQSHACSTERENQSVSEDKQEQVVIDTLNQALVPQLQIVQEEIASLEILAQELKEDPSNTELWDSAQEGWVSLMQDWQVVEAMQLSAFASSLDSDLGIDIRDEIYSWPTINPCRIDQETVLENWEQESFFSENLVNVYGLDTLEHLFFADLDTICPSQVPPVSDGTWVALGEEGVLENRAKYALALLGNISEHLDTQAENILAHDEQFTIEQRFQDRFTALFYLETMKDRKIGHVLGGQDCSTDLCLEDVEGEPSDRSLVWLQANVTGFRTLFTAGDGVGFDQLLIDAEYEDISTLILEQLDIIEPLLIELSDEHDGSLVQAIEVQPDKVQQVYDEMSVISGLLRVDMAAILQLKIPTEVAGDND